MEAATQDEFSRMVRPILAENCSACHNAKSVRGPANFLAAESTKDVESQRGLWHNVAAQLRNRTMPPVASKLTEQDRLMIATWIDRDLQRTACSGADYAGPVPIRPLNPPTHPTTI